MSTLRRKKNSRSNRLKRDQIQSMEIPLYSAPLYKKFQKKIYRRSQKIYRDILERK